MPERLCGAAPSTEASSRAGAPRVGRSRQYIFSIDVKALENLCHQATLAAARLAGHQGTRGRGGGHAPVISASAAARPMNGWAACGHDTQKCVETPRVVVGRLSCMADEEIQPLALQWAARTRSGWCAAATRIGRQTLVPTGLGGMAGRRRVAEPPERISGDW